MTCLKTKKESFCTPAGVPHNGVGSIIFTYCALCLFVSLIVVFAIDVQTGWRISSWAAINRSHILDTNEFYRLVTFGFCHTGIWHLLNNLLVLIYTGFYTEYYYGHAKFCMIFLGSSIIGGLCSLAFSDLISVGASAGIFGCFGALVAALPVVAKESWEEYRNMKNIIIAVIVYNVIMGIFATGIDHWGHIGGFVGGFLLGNALDVYLEIDHKIRKKIFTILTCAFVAGLAIVLFTCPQNWVYNGLYTIIEKLREWLLGVKTELGV